ncbi:hypothetical protein GX51_02807 [Blastomyces parvus]|uniref:Uncharacterized protein n=1 Tax=Blastomyces parvus TaxID=2060905 RepID=A0A2B7XAH4_9EURO|nr:hypothetical protein GX51_02807 [Blastomyces parvus]
MSVQNTTNQQLTEQFTALDAHYNTHYATRAREGCGCCLHPSEGGPLHRCIVSPLHHACDNGHFRGLKCYAIPNESYSIVDYYIRRLKMTKNTKPRTTIGPPPTLSNTISRSRPHKERPQQSQGTQLRFHGPQPALAYVLTNILPRSAMFAVFAYVASILY